MKRFSGWRLLGAMVVVAAGLASIIATEAIDQIGKSLADDDNDGWFTNAKNRKTVLTLSSATFSQGGQYRVIVDEVRFPTDPTLASIDNWLPNATANTALTMSVPVAKRVYGTNIIKPTTKTRIDYASTVKVQHLGFLGAVNDIGTGTVAYNSDGGQSIPVTIGGGGGTTATLTFTTVSTDFADPNPSSSTGDSDSDGIPEIEEASMAASFAGIGDPEPGAIDIVLIVGWTEPGFAIDAFTQELLKSRFFQRGINLHFDSGTLNGQAGAGGLMGNLGVPGGVPAGSSFSIGQTATIRALNIPAARRRFARFALLAAGVSAGGFGLANNIPGNHLIMRAILAPLSPNFANYQSGVLMHEFGHLLGLCHPTQQDGTTCPAIPQVERDPGATVMGAPSENPGILGGPAAVVNALRRPLDYSATQWGLLTPASGLAP